MYYRMWYWDYNTLYAVSAIGYTESPDGENWFNYQSCQNGTVPIVTGGSTGWNRGSYGPSDVLYNPSASNSGTDWVFTMYYDGTTGGNESIGLAFSSDGITWTGYDADSDGSADPVLAGTAVIGDWDTDYVSRATVIKNDGDNYEMWYSGGVGAMNNGIGYATSSDGLNWTRDAGNPLIHKDDAGYPGHPWRSNRTYCPAVIRQATAYKMWFAGRNSDGNYAIGYMADTIPTADLAHLEATHQGDAIRLAWETTTGLDILGFNLFRASSPRGSQTQINASLIPAGTPGSRLGTSYSFLDRAVKAGITYCYWLEGVDFYGTATQHGPVAIELPVRRQLLPARQRLAPTPTGFEAQ